MKHLDLKAHNYFKIAEAGSLDRIQQKRGWR